MQNNGPPTAHTHPSLHTPHLLCMHHSWVLIRVTVRIGPEEEGKSHALGGRWGRAKEGIACVIDYGPCGAIHLRMGVMGVGAIGAGVSWMGS